MGSGPGGTGSVYEKRERSESVIAACSIGHDLGILHGHNITVLVILCTVV